MIGIIQKVRSRNWRCSSEVEFLLSMLEAVGLIPGILPPTPHLPTQMSGFRSYENITDCEVLPE